jgi:hypothetical protein
MKRILKYLFTGMILSFLVVSCAKEEPSFDEQLLIGKWRSGTEFYRYDSDGTGATWDTGDDVSEDEAQEFTWTLIKSDLTHIHIMELGGRVPKYYTVTELTATTLKYKDEFGKNFSFVKADDD